jgi:hypothetical protein
LATLISDEEEMASLVATARRHNIDTARSAAADEAFLRLFAYWQKRRQP